MSEFNDGGPAFPSENNHAYFHGMTLRDYFAAKAMQAIIAHEGCSDAVMSALGAGGVETHSFAQNDAVRAYTYADAMLAERAK